MATATTHPGGHAAHNATAVPGALGAPPSSSSPLSSSSLQHQVQVIPLGAGQEVGRSCIIVKFLDKTIMFDCGIHPGYHGHASLPFLDHIDLSTVDVMLVTHFHMDHIAAVPFVVGRTNFKGRVLMTHPTKAIGHTLLKDYVKLNSKGGGSGSGIYGDKDVEMMMERAEVIDFGQTVDVDGVRITAYRAGHVLGAAMFMVEVAGMRCLYTGDYSRIADRHMPAADLPVDQRPNIVIVESTYGVSRHLPRREREEKFAAMVHSSVSRGGRVLLPVVALGRAQELLLILEEYWSKHPELHGVPIYQASGLARRAMTVYRSYIEMMNDDIREALKRTSNPFQFKHVTHLRSTSQFDDVGPCVVMATPSMLQSGMSRELFEAWCGDPKNCTIIADFAVQGTLARDILSSPKDIMAKSGARLPLRCQVDAISFSAHADFPQTSEFLDALDPPHVVLVHGEANEMQRLKKALEQRSKVLGSSRTVYTPKVTEEVLIAHAPKRKGGLYGSISGASNLTKPTKRVQGVVVKKNGHLSVMNQDDLGLYTKLQTGSVTQRQSILYNGKFKDLRLSLEMTFDDVFFVDGGESGDDDSQRDGNHGSHQMVRIGENVTVTSDGGGSGRVVLEWVSGSSNDLIADAVIALILLENDFGEDDDEKDGAGAKDDEIRVLERVLHSQFGETRVDDKAGKIFVEVEGRHVIVECVVKGGGEIAEVRVTCADGVLKGRVEKALERLLRCMRKR